MQRPRGHRWSDRTTGPDPGRMQPAREGGTDGTFWAVNGPRVSPSGSTYCQPRGGSAVTGVTLRARPACLQRISTLPPHMSLPAAPHARPRASSAKRVHRGSRWSCERLEVHLLRLPGVMSGQCFAKCPFTCQFDRLSDPLCQSLDRFSDHFGKHCERCCDAPSHLTGNAPAELIGNSRYAPA
jgi:hypothetical protein